MQQAEHFVDAGHVADPSVPGCVGETVAEAGEDEDEDEDGVRGVDGCDGVGDEVAGGGGDGYAALAETEVDGVVKEGGGGVADDGAEEDEGDNGVGEPVVGFELVRLGRVGKTDRGVGDLHMELEPAIRKSGLGQIFVYWFVNTYPYCCIVCAHDDEAPETSSQTIYIYVWIVPPLQLIRECRRRRKVLIDFIQTPPLIQRRPNRGRRRSFYLRQRWSLMGNDLKLHDTGS
jgi:hypothetical protein